MFEGRWVVCGALSSNKRKRKLLYPLQVRETGSNQSATRDGLRRILPNGVHFCKNLRVVRSASACDKCRINRSLGGSALLEANSFPSRATGWTVKLAEVALRKIQSKPLRIKELAV